MLINLKLLVFLFKANQINKPKIELIQGSRLIKADPLSIVVLCSVLFRLLLTFN